MMAGPSPFTLDASGKLQLALAPVVASWMWKADGTLDKYKSRCCLQGNWMEKGKDYAESFSIGSRISSVKSQPWTRKRASPASWRLIGTPLVSLALPN